MSRLEAIANLDPETEQGDDNLMEDMAWALSAGGTAYAWDAAAQRLRYRSNGRLVPRALVVRLAERARAAARAELLELGERLAGEDIDPVAFHEQAALAIRQLHVQDAVRGAEGFDLVDAATWVAVGAIILTQISSARDQRTGRRFGMSELLREWQAGDVTPRRLTQRLEMYGDASKLSYWTARTRREEAQGKAYGYRVLGVAEHCPECIALSQLPPMRINELVMPTQDCRCGANCKCSIVPLTLEEAVAMGARV